MNCLDTKRDLLDGFMTKAKQVSKLIDSFPNVDVDPERVSTGSFIPHVRISGEPSPCYSQDDRLKSLEEEMKIANSEYKEAVKEAGEITSLIGHRPSHSSLICLNRIASATN